MGNAAVARAKNGLKTSGILLIWNFLQFCCGLGNSCLQGTKGGEEWAGWDSTEAEEEKKAKVQEDDWGKW